MSFGKAKVFSMTKGFHGRNRNVYNTAQPRLEKALQYAYVGRKLKKRENRSLWISQINAGTREYGLKYSTFQRGLTEANIALNRKMLSDLAISEPLSFRSLVLQVQSLDVEGRREAVHKQNREARAKREADLLAGQPLKPLTLSLRGEAMLAAKVDLALRKQKNAEKAKKAKEQRMAKAGASNQARILARAAKKESAAAPPKPKA